MTVVAFPGCTVPDGAAPAYSDVVDAVKRNTFAAGYKLDVRRFVHVIALAATLEELRAYCAADPYALDLCERALRVACRLEAAPIN